MLDKAPNDRQIHKLPPAYLATSTPFTGSDFRSEVKSACHSNRLITSGLKISKVIVLGNVAVGKSCLVNRYMIAHIIQEYYSDYCLCRLYLDSVTVYSIKITRQQSESILRLRDSISCKCLLIYKCKCSVESSYTT